MKKAVIIFVCLIIVNLAWMGFIREPLMPIPEICAEISDEVDFKFTINEMDYTGLELAMNENVEGKGMFIEFQMANAWKTGRSGLVIKGIKANKGFKNGMTPDKYLKDDKRKETRKEMGDKDFSDFMKDEKGKSVSTYSLKHTLVEGEKGGTFLRMTYDGPAMEMIQTLDIPRPITIPAHISHKFVSKGNIQFQPGTVAFDSKIKGFYIPVVIK